MMFTEVIFTFKKFILGSLLSLKTFENVICSWSRSSNSREEESSDKWGWGRHWEAKSPRLQTMRADIKPDLHQPALLPWCDSQRDTPARRGVNTCLGSEPGKMEGVCQKGVRIPSEFVFHFTTIRRPPGLLLPENLPKARALSPRYKGIKHPERSGSENKRFL